MAAYLLMNCWAGLQRARVLLRQEKLPRRAGFACPSCRSAPPLGPHWTCSQCSQPFDTFASGAVCPHCSARFPVTTCLYCYKQHPVSEWAAPQEANFGVLNGGETVR
jgi:DNA-directed RNA polymerase subunit RPC12/RpoP